MNLHLLQSSVNMRLKNDRSWSSVRTIGCVGVSESQWIFALWYGHWSGVPKSLFSQKIELAKSDDELLVGLWRELSDLPPEKRAFHPVVYLFSARHIGVKLEEELNAFHQSKDPNRAKLFRELMGTRWKNFRAWLLGGSEFEASVKEEVQKEVQLKRFEAVIEECDKDAEETRIKLASLSNEIMAMKTKRDRDKARTVEKKMEKHIADLKETRETNEARWRALKEMIERMK